MYTPEESSPDAAPSAIPLFPEGSPLPHEKLLELLRRRGDVERQVLDRMKENPLEALLTLLVGSSAAFYLAEREVNPRIRTFWDSLYYISTCASVGYADMFAQTQTGRAIATVVFTFGPALCAQVLNRPQDERIEAQAAQSEIVQKLDAIVAELRKFVPQ